MNIKVKVLLGLALLTISSLAFAEGNCPDGMVPIGGGDVVGCMPIQSNQNTGSVQPQGRWINRWGAVATDETTNVTGFGAATNARNKREAAKAAITLCKKNGGSTGCKIRLTYFNQCAVVAWGDTSYVTSNGPNLEETSQRALQKCSAATTNCKIFYTGCSEAEWVK
jgi:hypothetical protein